MLNINSQEEKLISFPLSWLSIGNISLIPLALKKLRLIRTVLVRLFRYQLFFVVFYNFTVGCR